MKETASDWLLRTGPIAKRLNEESLHDWAGYFGLSPSLRALKNTMETGSAQEAPASNS